MTGTAELPSDQESVPASEAAAVERIVAMIEARVRDAASKDRARRDAHPKAHACLQAEFQVLPDLPPELRVGIFATPRSFQAWVRFSNGSEKPQGDAAGDGRGMAIKLLGVADSPSGTQDFLLINHPVFFVRSAADYVEFQAASSPLRFFLPGINPFNFRLREALIAFAITRQKVVNPIDTRYFSMVPFLFGDTACKFSARPAGAPSAFAGRDTEHFLRDNLVRHLAQGDAAFEFLVQRRTQPATMPVEDPTVQWDEAAAPYVPVARIVIPRQVFATPERDALGESLAFTPWHCVPEHRPIGGINRVRRTAYETISSLRHRLNGTERSEPAATAS